MRVVLLLAHEIEEYQQTLLMHELGHEVFSLGAYIRPSRPGHADTLRPPLPQVPEVPQLLKVIDELAVGKPSGFDNVTAAKVHLPDEVIEWADVLICHHLEHTWLAPQWRRIRDKRVIWRTVGQSGHGNEMMMRPLRDDGLQVIRYSPRERNIPGYIGEDALIRFWMDPEEWGGWNGLAPVVTNITQDLYRRSCRNEGVLHQPGEQWTSWRFWEDSTRGLPRIPAGAGSERLEGGIGKLPLDAMQQHLRDCRAYLYTGTQPASYTLGFIEALMTGIPVVSIGPAWHRILRTDTDVYGTRLFEAHELAPLWSDRPDDARRMLRRLLDDDGYAQDISMEGRASAIEHFGKARIRAQWADFLGAAVALEREAVPA